MFPGVRALDEATLRLEAGSVHALLGENGAGKSTLIKILTGVHRPDAGRLRLGGRRAHPPLAARRRAGRHRRRAPGTQPGPRVHRRREHRAAAAAGAGAAWSTGPRSAREARRCLDLLDLDLDPDTPPVRPVGGADTAGRDREGAVDRQPGAAARRADHREHAQRGRAAVRRGAPAAGPGHGDPLRQPQAGGGVRALRHGHGAARRRLGAGVRAAGRHNRDEVVDLMVGRAHRATRAAAAARAERRPALELDAVSHRRPGTATSSLSVRRGEIVGLYGLVGAGRSELAKALLGPRPGDRWAGAGATAGRPDPRRPATRCTRHGIGYVPEDRKEEGLFLDQPVTRNIAVTVWDRIAGGSACVPSVARTRARRRLHGAARHPAGVDRPARRAAVRRQPAEGQPRQVAGRATPRS